MGWGYFFGFLKANFVDSAGHFIFDSSTFGFYLALILNFQKIQDPFAWKSVKPWLIILVFWPIFMSLIPIQHYLIQLVGLRGNILWLPMLLVGAVMDGKAKSIFSMALVLLNCVALGFAVAEYIIGVEFFIPTNQATTIVFNSNDIVGNQLRIPSIFANAHSYAGSMVATVPWLLGELIDNRKNPLKSYFLILGLVACVLGVFLAGPRQPVVVLGLVIALFLLMGRINLAFLICLLVVGSVGSYFVYQNERMQRFMQLQDYELVQARMGMSFNSYFFDLALNYPMGNGMGAGGTSIPFFLQAYLTNAVGLENEYSRILLEQGLIGLGIWIAFIIWLVLRKIDRKDPAYATKKICWIYSVVVLLTSWIGVGMMTTVPGTVLLMLAIGICVAPSLGELGQPSFAITMMNLSGNMHLPAYQRGLARA
jgi:O-antigen ligase